MVYGTRSVIQILTKHRFKTKTVIRERDDSMSLEEKSIEELLIEVHRLISSGPKIRKLEVDPSGNLLLDRNNPSDVEWYENDEAYESISFK